MEKFIKERTAQGYKVLEKVVNKLGEYSIVLNKGNNYIVKINFDGLEIADESQNKAMTYRIHNSYVLRMNGF